MNIYSRINGIGKFIPSRLVTNDDLTKMMDTSDEWIQKRTGIKQRYWVDNNQSTSELAVPAALEAIGPYLDLARALGGYDLSEVGKLVWASQG